MRGSPSGPDGGEDGLPAAVRRAGFADVTTGPVAWLSYVKARRPGDGPGPQRAREPVGPEGRRAEASVTWIVGGDRW